MHELRLFACCYGLRLLWSSPQLCLQYETVCLPFAISELGYAVVSSARRVGSFHWRLGGDLCSHGLHQTFQLTSWKTQRWYLSSLLQCDSWSGLSLHLRVFSSLWLQWLHCFFSPFPLLQFYPIRHVFPLPTEDGRNAKLWWCKMALKVHLILWATEVQTFGAGFHVGRLTASRS